MTLLVVPVQDDDEGDTVGCCTLKIENVKAIGPNKLEVRFFKFVEIYERSLAVYCLGYTSINQSLLL